MRFYQKIFIYMFVFVAAALSVSGYFLVYGTFNNNLNREKNYGLEEYHLIKFTIQSGMLGAVKGLEPEVSDWRAGIEQAKSLLPSGTEFSLPEIYEGLSFDFQYVADGTRSVTYDLQSHDGLYWMSFTGGIEHGEQWYPLVFCRNVTAIYDERDLLLRSYVIIFSVLLVCGTVIMYPATWLLTRSVRQLTKASQRLAEGNYSQRVQISGKDEISQLSGHFNRMAETIEEKIADLEDSVKRQEAFSADFAHELKTPMTSIIGYADMLYQKELGRERVKAAAGYILNEGMRLENLAKKMMDLIVMERQDFFLEDVRVQDFMSDIQETMIPVAGDYQAEINFLVDDAWVKMEYDLLKTMVINLLDNGLKADARYIEVNGTATAQGYTISVTDNGKGMAAEVLPRITEAFYQGDQSRALTGHEPGGRHSAGLGLSIGEKIARVHHTHLQFDSEQDVGTVVKFTLEMGEAAYNEDD